MLDATPRPTVSVVASTRVTQRLNARRAAVYRALLDPVVIAKWRVPNGMSCQVHEFDAREGSSFRISLTYDDPTRTGKTSRHRGGVPSRGHSRGSLTRRQRTRHTDGARQARGPARTSTRVRIHKNDDLLDNAEVIGSSGGRLAAMMPANVVL